MEDCSGGRVRHPATHKETVKLWKEGDVETVTGKVCDEHFTSKVDWEVDGWEVLSIRRSKL